MKTLLVALASLCVAHAAMAQYTNQYGTSNHAYLPGPGTSGNSSGMSPGNPFANANVGNSTGAALAAGFGAALWEANQRNMQQQQQQQVDNGYGGDYTNQQLMQMQQMEMMRQQAAIAQDTPVSPAELARQQREQERIQREAEKEAQRQAIAEQKRLAKENAAIDSMYSNADAAAAAAQEDAFRKLEAKEYWKRASNNIWNGGEKDPWKNFRDKMDAWENSIGSLDRNDPDRPWLNDQGKVTTLGEEKARTDKEYLRDTLKSPNGGPGSNNAVDPQKAKGDKEWLELIKSPNAKNHPPATQSSSSSSSSTTVP